MSNLRAHATTRIVRLLFKLSPLRDRTQAALPVLRVGPGAKPKRPRSQRVSRCKFSMRSRISGTAAIPGKLIPRSRRKRRMHRRRSTQVDENNGPERVTVEASINPKPTNVSTRLRGTDAASAKSSRLNKEFALRQSTKLSWLLVISTPRNLRREPSGASAAPNPHQSADADIHLEGKYLAWAPGKEKSCAQGNGQNPDSAPSDLRP
jgi:hypothetical protein